VLSDDIIFGVALLEFKGYTHSAKCEHNYSFSNTTKLANP